MKLCPSCGWNNADHRTACVKCAAKLPDAPKVTQSTAPNMSTSQQSSASTANQPSHTPVIIQARSESCTAKIEQSSAAVNKYFSTVILSCTLAALAVLGSNYIVAILEDRSFRYVDPPSMSQYLIAIVSVAIGWILSIKVSQKSQENLNVYRRYCATESLIVDNEKIYGSTSIESVKLYYNMIEGVRYRPSSASTSGQFHLGCVDCDVLEILGTNRKVYTFYSFANCKELKTIIEMNMHNQR